MKRERKSVIPSDFSSKTGAVIKRLFEKNTPETVTVVKEITVVPELEKGDKKTTVIKKSTVGKKNTVGLKTTVTFAPFEELLSESDPNYWFKYVVVLHWLMDNFLPALRFRASSVYVRLVRLAYGIKSNKGMCKVGSTALGKSSGITKKYVRQAVKELKMAGAIEIVETENKGQKGGGSIYRVFIPKESIQTVVKMNTVVQDNPIIKDDSYNISNHHREDVKKIYSEVTGNKWINKDDDSYLKVKDFDITTIEKALKISIQRAKSHPNSFEFFVKQIQRFGNPSEEERKKLKKALGELVNFTRQVRVGGNPSLSLEEDVKRRCEKEGVFFNEELYQEILDESYHGHWEPH